MVASNKPTSGRHESAEEKKLLARDQRNARVSCPTKSDPENYSLKFSTNFPICFAVWVVVVVVRRRQKDLTARP